MDGVAVVIELGPRISTSHAFSHFSANNFSGTCNTSGSPEVLSHSHCHLVHFATPLGAAVGTKQQKCFVTPQGPRVRGS